MLYFDCNLKAAAKIAIPLSGGGNGYAKPRDDARQKGICKFLNSEYQARAPAGLPKAEFLEKW